MYGNDIIMNESMAWNDNRRPFNPDGPKESSDGGGAVADARKLFHSAIVPHDARIPQHSPHADEPATKGLFKASHD